MTESGARPTGVLVTLALTAGYLGSFWNACLAPTVGGELFALAEIAAGRLPYRDFYHAGQPLPFLLPLLFEELFGRLLIPLWAFGALLRVAAAVCLYQWISRFVRPWAACAGVVTGFVVSSGDVADFPAFYNHSAISYAVVGAYLGWLATRAAGRRALAFGVGAGFFLALNFLTKQTTGILIPAAVLPVLVLAAGSRKGRPGVVALLAALAAGALPPLVLSYGWLHATGLLKEHVAQAFLSAPSSKGGLVSTLLRPFLQPFTSDLFGQVPASGLAGGLAAGALAALGLRRTGAEASRTVRVRAELAVALPLLAAILAGRAPRLGEWLAGREPLLAASFGAMVGSLVLGVLVAFRASRERGAEEEELAVLTLAALGFSCAYSLSISWPVFEVMAFPGLAILISWALAALAGKGWSRLAQGALVAGCVLLVAVGAWRKSFLPFSWGWTEPPLARSTSASSLPELAGFVLAPSTVAAFDGVTALVRRYSAPDEMVWVFPAMPVFYGLADRRPATYAAHQWMDTCPDAVAEADARRVLEAPPAVIVAQIRSADSYTALESVFRSGRRSGQRSLDEALRRLLPRYDLVGSFPTEAVVPCPPILVFALRRDEARGAAERRSTGAPAR